MQVSESRLITGFCPSQNAAAKQCSFLTPHHLLIAMKYFSRMNTEFHKTEDFSVKLLGNRFLYPVSNDFDHFKVLSIELKLVLIPSSHRSCSSLR